MSVRDRIRMLVEILGEEDLDEIEVRGLFSGIRVARRRVAEAAVKSAAEDAPAPQELPVQEPSEESSAPPPEHEEAEEGLERFLSPMVGTFYRSAGPGKDPFISEGSLVETGQVLCIIEAMKLMNEIEAESRGVIRKILVEDSQPVEFGQPLFLVESA